MSDMDLGELGRKIGKEVEKFISSDEIKGLQRDIRETVEKTVDDVRQTARDASDYMNRNIEIRWEDSLKKAGQDTEKTGPWTEAWLSRKRQQEAERKAELQRKAEEEKKLPVVKRPGGSVGSILMIIFGSIGAGLGSLAALGTLFWILLTDAVLLGLGGAALLLPLAFTGLSTAMAVAGGIIRGRISRFKQYVKTMGEKEVCAVEDLARAVDSKGRRVIKDLKTMIRKGWFREGHLDRQETSFMLTDGAYQLYQEAMVEHARRREEEELLEKDPVRKQLKLAAAEGDEYIRRIREINDSIPGGEISGKLCRLEEVCKRIFGHVESNPEKLGDIRKFMSYYLPTTLKLVEAYHGFYYEPVQGENIVAARQEIEETLDDINAAFEKLLDKLFQEDAMDISADISVLSTMLAQEGLLEDEFIIKK
ncbi:MAG: 5-bromo-4-chloroindolyl phosphate hydrolysis family protein [Lachnospiraceae bacterium]|nr:5-bromo-4-chloroindolyl phosphate hydrolysis family protein [Lachnospiraceae bacterium]